MGGADVFSIIALIIVISISCRRQTRRCSGVCGETEGGWLISHPVFVIDSLFAFTALLVPLFAPLLMQGRAQTLNSSSFWDLLYTEQYREDGAFGADDLNACAYAAPVYRNNIPDVHVFCFRTPDYGISRKGLRFIPFKELHHRTRWSIQKKKDRWQQCCCINKYLHTCALSGCTFQIDTFLRNYIKKCT